MILKRLLVLSVLITISSSVFAQRFNQQRTSYGARDSRFESSVLLTYQNGANISTDNGSMLDIDKSAGWGITIGYNWTAKWNIAYKLMVTKPDYTATIIADDPELTPQTIDYTMNKYSHQINATYNFLDRSFTPFVQLGAGMTTLDSNIPDRPPTSDCWWDPWWGYICSTTWSTYKKTRFAYNAGLGIRWELNNAFFLRGAYNMEWVSLTSGTIGFSTLTLEAGLLF